MSELIIEDAGPMGNWGPRIFVATREYEIHQFIHLVNKAGGEVYSVLMLPYRNAWGQLMPNKWDYVIVYQASDEIGMEIKT